MDRETLRALSELGVAALALIAVIIFAYTMFNRSKSDTSVIKVFADIVSNSIKDMSQGLEIHGNESTSRHGEVVLALQMVNTSLAMLIDNDRQILQSVEEVKQTGGQIMATVTPLEQSLAEIRDELRRLRESVEAQFAIAATIRDDVTARTTQIEERLLQVEKRATQEQPAIPAEPKPKAPGVPVTPKPKDETEKEKES